MPLHLKVAKADIEINNDGSQDDLEKKLVQYMIP